MSNAAWACNDCDTNNLVTADRCRVCEATRAQAAGAVSEPTPAGQRAALTQKPPAFVESKHAEPPAGSRVRLTSSAPRTPPETPPFPASPGIFPRVPELPPPPSRPMPSWPSPPLLPSYRPSDGASRVARKVWWWVVILAVVAGVFVVGNWNSIMEPGTHRAPSRGQREGTSAPTCPAEVARWLPGGGYQATLEAAFTTPRHVITLCRTESGQLYYDGQVRGKAPTSDSHISIPATATGSGYSARNDVYLYKISGSEVIVSKNGVELSRQPLTRTGP